MKILVTGAAGFIGFHLIKKLCRSSCQVLGLDNINDYYDINLKFARLNEIGIERENAEKFNKETQSVLFKNLKFIRLNLEDDISMLPFEPLIKFAGLDCFPKKNLDVLTSNSDGLVLNFK